MPPDAGPAVSYVAIQYNHASTCTAAGTCWYVVKSSLAEILPSSHAPSWRRHRAPGPTAATNSQHAFDYVPCQHWPLQRRQTLSLRVSGAVFKVSDFEGVFKVSDFAPSKMRSVRFRVVCKVSGCEMSSFRNFEPSKNFEPSVRIFEPSENFETSARKCRTFRANFRSFACIHVVTRISHSFSAREISRPRTCSVV